MKKLLLALPFLTLMGCSVSDDMSDLQAFMQETLNRPRGRIEPAPVFKVYETFIYSAGNMRSPFELPILENANAAQMNSNVHPDLTRSKEPLEEFALNQITMVGSIQQQGVLWALVKDGNGSVVRVKKGYYMGQNHGRISSITEQGINIIEIVPNGMGGWLERPRTLAIEGLAGE